MKKIILIIMAVLLAGCRKESGILQKDSVMQRKDPVTVWVNYTENEKMFSEGSAISNEGSLPGFVIKSRGELEEFYMNFRDILTLDYNGGEADFAAIMNDYDDSFFRENYLIMVYNIASSGSFRYSFDKAEISDRKLTLRIKQINDPEVYTCDMSGWLTLVPFTREQLKDVDTYDFGMTVTEETVFTNFCYDTVVQLPGHIAWGEFSFEEDKNDVRDRGWTVITEGFINNEPDTDRDSFTTSFNSSAFACDSDNSFHLFLPADLVGSTNKGITSIPIIDKRKSILNRATTVVITVAILEMIFVRVELITLDTPEISEFILVMISPCFSEVKKP